MKKSEKIEFREITLQDQVWMKEKFQESDLMACEFSYVNNYIWRKTYHTEVAEVCGCGICRCIDEGEYRYSYPFGAGDHKAALEKLIEHCTAESSKLYIYPIVAEQRDELLDYFPGKFEIDKDRSDFDYIYSFQKLSELKGKKLHGKRNHIARFKDDMDWSYEPLTKENVNECLEMAQEWEAEREEKWNESMEQEIEAMTEAVTLFEELGLVGGVLRKAEKIVAFTLGEKLNSNTFVVHFEKALPKLQGAYPMINQQFVQHACKDFAYINREEDTGDLGLRKAKLSYYPDILLEKYAAIESDIVFANKREESQIIDIWRECFKDEEAYIRFYLENRFTEENMLVIHEDGKIVSMASFLPVTIMQQDEMKEAKYVYAVATLPEYQKRGYAAKILEYAKNKYKCPLILQPSSEKRELYYGKHGFMNAFLEYEMHIDVNDIVENEVQVPNITIPDAKRYKLLRDKSFSTENYVCWDIDAIEYAIKENTFCGGDVLEVDEKFMMYRLEESTLYIIETDMDESQIQSIVKYLKKNMPFSKVIQENRGGMVYDREAELHIQSEEMGYLNLTLG